MLFKGQVDGYAVRVLLDSAVSTSFMSIEYARQLRLTWSTKEAAICLGDNKAGVALRVCRVTVYMDSLNTRWINKAMDIIIEYDLFLGNEWLKSHKVILVWENDHYSHMR